MKYLLFFIINIYLSYSALAIDHCYIEKVGTGKRTQVKKQIIDDTPMYTAQLNELRVEIIPQANSELVTRFLSNSDNFLTLFMATSNSCSSDYSIHEEALRPNFEKGGKYRFICEMEIECNTTSQNLGTYLFQPTLDSGDKTSFSQSRVFFATHSAFRWDEGLTKKSMQKITNNIEGFYGLKVGVGLSSMSSKSFNYNINKMDVLLSSGGGAHNLSFPNANEIFFTGGYLDQCLCESVRDVLTGLDFSKGEKSIYFINEGTYLLDDSSDLTLTATQLIEDKGKALRWLEKLVLGEDRLCPVQRTSSTPDHNRSDFTISVFFEDKEGKINKVQVFGSGKKVLNLKFISTETFLRHYLRKQLS